MCMHVHVCMCVYVSLCMNEGQGYRNRRINLTLLFGRMLLGGADTAAGEEGGGGGEGGEGAETCAESVQSDRGSADGHGSPKVALR